MLRRLAIRVAAAAPVLVLVALLSFSLLELTPGDPAVAIAGPNAGLEQIESIRSELGLDRPFWIRFGEYASSLVRGDLGTSLYQDLPVAEVILERLPVSLSLALYGLAFSAVGGVLLGVLSVGKPDGLIDRAIGAITSMGMAVPAFVVGMVLLTTFALNGGPMPIRGYVPLTQDPLAWAEHLVLPGTALGLAALTETSRQTRAALGEALAADSIRTARAKGLGRWRIIGRHGLKQAATPVLSVVGLQLNRLFGATVLIEVVFTMDGLGRLAVNSVERRDFPMVQGIIIVTAVVVVLSSILVDMSYGLVNPKSRSAT